MRILVTGFDPFDTHSVNPSGEVAEQLDGLVLSHGQVTGRVLKTSFETVRVDLPRLIEQLSPGLVLMFGLNVHIEQLRLESGAHNWVDAKKPDNLGCTPPIGPIDVSAPAWVPSVLDVEMLADRVRGGGVMCETSDNPGYFVCNFAYFAALRIGAPTVFVHLPGNDGYPLLLKDAAHVVDVCADLVCDG